MSRDFHAEQRAFWHDASDEHYRWQTGAPYIAATEAALLDGVDVRPGERLLEIGCGEGGNLHHLAGRGARFFGTDFSPAKAAFARRMTGAATVCADARALPFRDAAFDVVLVRDLLHHVGRDGDRARVVAETFRVLRDGGRLTVVEPNRWNPMVLAQALAVRAERGLLRSTAARVAAELRAAGFFVEPVERRQPLPISRVVLHPDFGRPALGARPLVAWALERLERAAERIPRPLWAYMIFHGRRP